MKAKVVLAIYPCIRFNNLGRKPGSAERTWDFRLDGVEHDY